MQISQIEKFCQEKNIKLTDNRKVIAQVISDSKDHPDVEELYKRASKINPSIGIATIYRTVKMLEEVGAITKHEFSHEFSKGRALYEILEDGEHHDHLIDITTGKIHEFFNQELEDLKTKIAMKMGYELVGHKLELYGKLIIPTT
jgi:Fur family ferric uptake transcriptional regulator